MVDEGVEDRAGGDRQERLDSGGVNFRRQSDKETFIRDRAPLSIAATESVRARHRRGQAR